MESRPVAEAGYRGFRAGRLIIIPGLANRLGAFSVRLSPRVLIRRVIRKLNTP